MAEATSWDGLARRLKDLGYELRPAGRGLPLYDTEGIRLCKSSEPGFAHARLVTRFSAAMPGHPHRMAPRPGPRAVTKKAAGPLPDGLVPGEDADGGQPFFSTSRPSNSAICTAFSAAPLRRLSETHQKLRPFSMVESWRMRLMKVA